VHGRHSNSSRRWVSGTGEGDDRPATGATARISAGVESLAREHAPAELETRLDELIGADKRFQEAFGVPDPDAVSTADLSVEDHDAVEQRWADLSEWRTVRRDIRVLRRAVERATRL